MFCTMSTSLVSSLVPYLDTSSPSSLTKLLISSSSSSPSSSLVSSMLPLPPLLPPSTSSSTTTTTTTTTTKTSTSTLLPSLLLLPPLPPPLIPPTTTSSSRKSNKVQFKDSVEVRYTHPPEEYDRHPIQPISLTANDYAEFQTMLNEMHLAIEKEVTTRQLKNWTLTSSCTFTSTPSSMKSAMHPFDLDDIVSPTSFHSPITMDLSVHELMEWGFNETELKRVWKK